MESVRNDLYEVLSNNSGKPFDEIVELCERGDKWLKGKEVVDLGFADKIIVNKSDV
jgi:ATP-dependent protease ClpP protease subunit